MTICYFGTYEKNYPRNRNVIIGLASNGLEVIECHEPLLEKIEDKTSLSFSKKINLISGTIKSYANLAIKRFRLPKVDYVIVGYMGQIDMILARVLFPTKKIFFNPMISLYDTIVNDREMSNNYFIKRAFYLLDKISCQLADKIILDTPEHAKYFQKEFKVPEEKLTHVYIGADNKVFYPLPEEKDDFFNVLFYGKFNPLQGIEYLVKAAKILESNKKIRFKIIGTGQTYKKIIFLAKNLGIKNITFIDWVPFQDLPREINKADVCIGGHFGESEKAKRVVANKVFQIIAMKKPVIISDSPSSASAGFIDKENCLFCKTKNSKELAEKIIELKNNSGLLDKISKNGYLLFKNNFTPEKTAKKFKAIMEKTAKNNEWTPTPAYKIRKKIILNYLSGGDFKIKKFLEIGVGGGDLIKNLEQMSDSGEGIDISQEAIKEAKKLESDKIKIYQKNFFDIEKENEYDLIVGLELIEHLPDDLSALKKINRLLKNKGLLIISVPAHEKKWSILDIWAGHCRRYEKQDLIKKLEKQNFKIKKIYNYGFPLLNILLFIRKKIIDPRSAQGSLESNTKRSGMDRGLEKKFKFFFNDFFVYPFYLLQKLFLSNDLGPSYLVIAKKNGKFH